MGWFNIWGYVLILLFFTNFLFSNISDNMDYFNSEKLFSKDITNDFSLEELFLKNLIKNNRMDKVLSENNYENNFIEGDISSDENNYIFFKENIENIEDKIIEKDIKIFNIITNENVEKYIKFWSTPKKIMFIQEALNRAKPFIREIKKIFKEDGLPEELAYLPIIESGFKNNAYSRAKAVGPWQFILHTGRWIGMKIDMWIDERRDPIISARYAAKYLKFLYNTFNDWYLALAAYNYGGFNIKKSIKKVKINDYFELIKHRVLPYETRSYVPSFIAVLNIIKDKENYNIQYDEEEPSYDYILLPFMVPAYLVSKNANLDYKKFCELNPSLIAGFIPEKDYQYHIRLPKENIEILNSNIEKLEKESFYSYIPYNVKKGDTLSEISAKFGIPISIIVHINNIKNPSFLRIGQKIYIPKIKASHDKEVKKGKYSLTESLNNKDNGG